ncbi:hypothetical protein LEMLEM_LOCUS25841, partial [Lemmus lemmus]
MTLLVKIKMNVQNMTVAQRMLLATTLSGSYHCACDSGLESRGGGSTFQVLGESCEGRGRCLP